MLSSLLIVLPIGLAGIGAGVYSLTHRHKRAAIVSAALGMLTVLATLGVHGWAMARAFEAVARVPAEQKQTMLANAIADVQMNLPLGAVLAATCVGLSLVSWFRLRSAEG